MQKVEVKFLYYAITVDPTMMVALGTLSVDQSKATEDTKEAVSHLLD